MSSSIMALGRNPRQSRGLLAAHRLPARRGGFTLVEMLIAMAITLVMIGAVVTLFANISNSVRNRRAVIEMSGQMRHARNMLQKDLQGATCNGLVWQRPDENQGYIELIEGPQREGQASVLVDGFSQPDPSSANYNPEIDHRTSILPASNLPFNNTPATRDWLTDGGSLGDFDDILMLTVRNEHEPFIGRVPKTEVSTDSVRPNDTNANSLPNWDAATIESPLAEVVWYAVENPDEDNNVDTYFGEPGMRTIYRRALLIAPWFNPYRFTAPDGRVTDTFRIPSDSGTYTAQPGLVRVLPDDVGPNMVAEAIACLIAFQERYDLSVRLEFDPLLGTSPGRWKIVANTLGDLTKRENRYEHHFYRPGGNREYPFGAVSIGSGYQGNNLAFVADPEVVTGGVTVPAVSAVRKSTTGVTEYISTYLLDNPDNANGPYLARPFAYPSANSQRLATARAMLNDQGKVVRVVHGIVPLSGARKGEDVMLTDALGFDLRVYDPGAPLFAHADTETVLEPTDPAWTAAYVSNDNMGSAGAGFIGNRNAATNVDFPFVGQGAYVDLGYGFDSRRLPAFQAELPAPRFAAAFASATIPWFFTARALSDIYGNQLAPGYTVFDTWSFHYENNGLNEDRDETELVGGLPVGQFDDADGTGTPMVDEGTNGLDDPGHYPNFTPPPLTVFDTRLGPDDRGERETAPPYDKPLRGVQVVLRLYERDSRQIRQVSVNQSFVPE